ncbi:MAG: nucleotidyltransferase family protein [Planctomycetota bacterium]|nr:nucleotidyltransferase family protein [Planctomycetota bacterium]
MAGITFDDAVLAAFCQKHGIGRLSLFGSTLRGNSKPESDIDLLVEFKKGQRISLFDLGGMAVELEEMLGHPVDLRTAEDISVYFRDDVLRSAKLLYAA